MTTEDKKEEKLYAGKYKTVEDLEEGYKKSLPLYQENENLKKKLEEVSKTPDDYLIPKDVALDEADLAELKAAAKHAGITQTHFDKLAFDRQEKNKARAAKLEETKKELGQERINIINDYITKYYPDKIGQAVFNQIISDKSMLDAALKHRDQVLNSGVPGVGRVGAVGYAITREDLRKARNEMEKANYKDKKALQEKYINLTNQFIEANKNKSA